MNVRVHVDGPTVQAWLMRYCRVTRNRLEPVGPNNGLGIITSGPSDAGLGYMHVEFALLDRDDEFADEADIAVLAMVAMLRVRELVGPLDSRHDKLAVEVYER